MSSYLQIPLTTSSKPALTKIDQKKISLQAENIVNGLAFPMVLQAAIELGVIDTIVAADDDTWLSPSEIILRLPTKPTNPEAPVLLDRMLCLLASYSFLKCRIVETGKIERVYAAEPVSKLFLKNCDDSDSLATVFELFHSQVFFKTWTHLKDTILKGTDAFGSAHDMKLFEYIGSDEPFGELFNQAMSTSSNIVIKKFLENYKGLKDVKTLVDVGGGLGTVISLVTSKYTHIKGINFDLPQVVINAPDHPGVKHVAGDMFKEIPKGDAIFMKSILHDWTDEECKIILQNCWKSLPKNGKVIIVDMLLPDEPKTEDFSSNILFAMDMLMLTQCSGGKERYRSQFEKLADDSGFSQCEVICGAGSYSVIEFRKIKL